jgi:uncharacterized coiled-coil protein SlyX
MAELDEKARLEIENRLATLETRNSYLTPQVSGASARLTEISERMSRLEERISHLPTKEFVVKIVVSGILLAIGILTAIAGLLKFMNVLASAPLPK